MKHFLIVIKTKVVLPFILSLTFISCKRGSYIISEGVNDIYSYIPPKDFPGDSSKTYILEDKINLSQDVWNVDSMRTIETTFPPVMSDAQDRITIKKDCTYLATVTLAKKLGVYEAGKLGINADSLGVTGIQFIGHNFKVELYYARKDRKDERITLSGSIKDTLGNIYKGEFNLKKIF
jgi:hypothetical protein